MEHVRNWDVFHACGMYEPCMLHEYHYHECTMHEPCMHGLAVVSSPGPHPALGLVLGLGPRLGLAVEKAFCCACVFKFLVSQWLESR